MFLGGHSVVILHVADIELAVLYFNAVFQSNMLLSVCGVNDVLASYKVSFNLHLILPTDCL